MNRDTKPIDISKQVVVYRIPGMDDVKVLRDVEYSASDAGALTMDIYYPPGSPESAPRRLPAVVFVAGFPDEGFEAKVGCKFKEMGSSVSWARLTAASGLVAITYTNREPTRDLHALLQHIRRRADALGIERDRLGLWAGSGNVPLALSLLAREEEAGDYLKCAVLCYGYTLDLEGSTGVAEAAGTWGFVNPCAGKSVADLSQSLPLFIARAGQDALPHLNEALDRFLCAALAHNLPLTFVNHAAAPHAFDLLHDSESTRETIRHILSFLRFHLLAPPAASR